MAIVLQMMKKLRTGQKAYITPPVSDRHLLGGRGTPYHRQHDAMDVDIAGPYPLYVSGVLHRGQVGYRDEGIDDAQFRTCEKHGERKTALFQTRIKEGFWPATETIENVSRGTVCPRVYVRSADSAHAESRHARVCCAARLDDRDASSRGSFGQAQPLGQRVRFCRQF